MKSSRHIRRFGDHLKSLRESKKMSFGDVANKAGVQRTTAWKAENGYLPKGGTLKKLCTGLGLHPESSEAKRVHALWLSARTGQEVTPAQVRASIKSLNNQKQKELDAFLAQAAVDLEAVSSDLYPELLEIIRNPELISTLARLRRQVKD